MWCGVVLFLSWFTFVCCCFCSCYYSQLSKTDTVGAVLGRCPALRESNKGSKEKKGPTLGVRFIEVSSYTEMSVKKESTLLIFLSCLKYCINTAQHNSFQIAYLWNVAPFLCQVAQNLLIAIHYKSLYREQASLYIVFLFIQRIAFSTLKRQERFAFPLAFVCLPRAFSIVFFGFSVVHCLHYFAIVFKYVVCFIRIFILPYCFRSIGWLFYLDFVVV